jgi:prepilin-type N-terminal cleavage/methylation domain-containing protein
VRNAGARAKGFTLIELVVGVSVISGILATAYVCLHAGLRGQDDLLHRREAGQCARAAFALLGADLRAACRLSEDIEFVGMSRDIGGMEADNIDFATRNWSPRGPGEGGSTEVSWYVDGSREVAGLALWRRRDPTPDRDPLGGGFKEEIASGISMFKVEYSDGFLWYEEWGSAEGKDRMGTIEASAWNSTGLPEAVRITLAFPQSPAPLHPPGGEAAAPRGPTEEKEPAPKREEPRKDIKDIAGMPKMASEKDEKPPRPLTFRTVVRLNLAGAQDSGGSESSSGDETKSGGETTPGASSSSSSAAEPASGGGL